jgi:hypothetical protein
MTKEQKFLLLVVILVAGVGATLFVQNQKELKFSQNKKPNVIVSETQKVTEIPAAGSVVTAAATPTTPSVKQNQTKTHKTAVTYEVPEGHSETLYVTVSLTGGEIADISFTENPSNKDSAKYYNGFQKAFSKTSFVGKSVDEISLSRLGGASLTTEAFMNALATIKKESSS